MSKINAFEHYQVHGEDGYCKPFTQGAWKMGLYGWFYGPKMEHGIESPWGIAIFPKHVVIIDSAPVLVVREVLGQEGNKSKKVIRTTHEGFEKDIDALYPDYADVDHDAIFRRNSARLHEYAQRIIKSREN